MTANEPARPREPYDLATTAHDYPAWFGTPRRTILICSHPRSGSTLLGEALYFAGGMGCPLEYFHSGFRPGFERRWQVSDPRDYIEATHRWRTDPGGTFGVKLFWRDVMELAVKLDPDRFTGPLNARPVDLTTETYRAVAALLAPIFPNPTFVHLERRDHLRQAVSAMVATDTGLWRSIPGVGEQTPIAEPAFDYDRIERMIAYSRACHAHWRNLFAAVGAEPLSATYEDLARDHDAVVSAVFNHLGSDAAPPPARMRRQADGRSEAMLLRFLRENAARAMTREQAGG
jgi:trehalose 2-sulfotransferase